MKPWRPQFRAKTEKKDRLSGVVWLCVIVVTLLHWIGDPIADYYRDRGHDADMIRVTHVQEFEELENRITSCLRRGKEWNWLTNDRKNLEGKCVRDGVVDGDAGDAWSSAAPGKLSL